ncbi:MAG: glutamate 5-kinase [Desulfobacteraceae bacterium]|nr:MAG: glutamate 5-kinase [Desulfobacteraceae bacterium]
MDLENAHRAVVKIGSGVLTNDNGLNVRAIRSISGQIHRLMDRGIEIILVSSGAMASGVKKVGLPKRPEEIPKRQAVAAVGQAGLMMEYEKAFSRYGRQVAQILLTHDDLNHRERYLNARNTLHVLLSWKIVPIINENDTVAVEEIKFGDNDNLSAMIALLMDAHVLVNLTDIDGLYDKDPRRFADAELMPEVSLITQKIEKAASGIPGALSTGGMLGKIQAAKKVTAAGIPMVIAKGEKPNILIDLFGGKRAGTVFIPKQKKMASRKCWIAFSSKPKGVLTLDDGAASAVLNQGKSLLPSGIIGVDGEFQMGAPVQFKGAGGEILGIGLVNYSSEDIRKIMGLRSDRIRKRLGHKSFDEIIHRDNLAITAACEKDHQNDN